MVTIEDKEVFQRWLHNELPSYLEEARKNDDSQRAPPTEPRPSLLKYIRPPRERAHSDVRPKTYGRIY
jgi:hypothetical protein